MEHFTIIVVAVGLAMDAFAVSVASGSAYKKLHVAHAFRIAAFFGGFQALMPLIGYSAGIPLGKFIGGFDHWVAFGLLSAIGIKMIYESFKLNPSEKNQDYQSVAVLLALSVATSIDALAVGISLSLLKMALWEAVAIIGVITFLLSYLGVYIGNRFGHFFENRIEIVGGLVLIGIGIKILIQHMV